MKNKAFFIFIFLMTFVFTANTQSILNTRIDIDVTDVSVEDALKEIENAGGFYFAYNTAYIDAERTVTMKRTNEPVKGILDDLFAKRFKYLPVGHHVVLSPRPKRSEKTQILLSGYITDKESNPLDSVIVYVVDEERVTLTKMDGFYSIRLKPAKESICISFSHPSYEDTLLHIRPDDQNINICLYRKYIPRDTAKVNTLIAHDFTTLPMDSVCHDLALVRFFVPDNAVYVANELNTTWIMPAQISFVPGIGSNALVNGMRTNCLSLNMLAGYAQGVRGVEMGGLVNVIQKDVMGGQFAGLANIVNGKTTGMQVSGVFNYNFGRIYGMQAAGLANMTRDSIAGGQMGGLFNFSKGSVTGLQSAGLVNVAGARIIGAQMAGFANVNIQPIYGAQMAGIANNTKKVAGVQMSGIYNYANAVKGAQFAGLVNIVKDTLSGIQVAGLANRTKVLRGMQIGLVNITDTIECGIPIGLFNYVKNGYRAFEVSWSESYPFDFYYKTGGNHIYTILNIGLDKNEFAVGYGMGYHQPLFPRIATNVEVLNTSMLSMMGDLDMGTKYIARLALEVEIFKHFSLLSGISFNHFIPESKYDSPMNEKIPFSSGSDTIIEQAIDSGERASWFGWFLGFCF